MKVPWLSTEQRQNYFCYTPERANDHFHQLLSSVMTHKNMHISVNRLENHRPWNYFFGCLFSLIYLVPQKDAGTWSEELLNRSGGLVVSSMRPFSNAWANFSRQRWLEPTKKLLHSRYHNNSRYTTNHQPYGHDWWNLLGSAFNKSKLESKEP